MGITKDQAEAACEAILTGDELGDMLYFVQHELDEGLLWSSRLPSHDHKAIVAYLRRANKAPEAAQPQPGATSAQTGMQAGGSAAADMSGTLVPQMLAGVPPLTALPRDAQQLNALLSDWTGLRIPVPASTHASLQSQLTASSLALLVPVAGYHKAAAAFARLIADPLPNAGQEMTTTIGMHVLMSTTFDMLSTFSPIHLPLLVQSNRTELGADSLSGAVPFKARPDMLVVHNMATLAIGEDKAPNMLHKAVEDLKQYVAGGLGAVQYGTLPGILGYAASGFTLQLYFISTAGQVDPVGGLLDLSSAQGRLDAVCSWISYYRIMALMSTQLPALDRRLELWKVVQRGPAQVMLKPGGAIKTVSHIKSSGASGINQNILTQAYQVAAAAAAQQQRLGQPPFLVRATQGPNFSRSYLEVHTTPLGFSRPVRTEQDARCVALACLKSACVLHEAGIVHTDFRLQNIVWLDEEHCMVIDLEDCRAAMEPLPARFRQLIAWDECTLEQRGDQLYFTYASDLYQVGLMLAEVLQPDWSPAAHAFVGMLRSARRPPAGGQQDDAPVPTARSSLEHEWLSQP